MGNTRDFGGYATRYNIKCTDGRTILPGAFDGMDGEQVPLVWNHMHDSPLNVLGHAVLHCKEDGVYADCYLNDTTQGKNVREALKNKDYKALSIYANNLKQTSMKEVMHGVIREVSLVLAGANSGAFIDTAIAHSYDGEEADEGVIWMFKDDDWLDLAHSDENSDPEPEPEPENTEKETSEMGAEIKETDAELEHSDDKERTIEDVVNTMNEEQKKVMMYLIGQAASKGGKKEEVEHSDKGEEDMKPNAFEAGAAIAHGAYGLTKAEQKLIIDDMQKYGSLKDSYLAHKDDMGIEDILSHGSDVEYSTDQQNYFVNDPSFLFPEYKTLNNPPAFIKRDTGWVAGVLSGVKHVPFSRIKSVFADITEDEARAKGYIKGDQKINEVFTLLRRTTDPQTIYKLQTFDRDDVLDITDFDVVAWIKSEMRMMLDEEIARAILIGDGKLTSDRTHIAHDHIRPIWTDDDLFTIKKFVEYAANASEDVKAKEYIRAAVKARKDYKGSGNPVFYTTEDILTDMLLLEDNMGHRLYKSEAELASAMRVSRIVTVQVMENQKRTVSGVDRDLVGIIVNLSDYTVGADKGGQVSMFDDFNINYNKMEYLIETRCSGALTVPYSAIVIESAQAA
ncbi:MAG: phage major capsid protein [Pseudobutyrivibrio sp.]|nr:phage major capsid protein [Pseudobutyrivibrio sp.]